MSIRFARLSDIPAMLDIYGHYVRNTTYSFEYTVPTEEEFTRRFRQITEQFAWLVWEEGGQVLGYAYGSAPFERAAYQWCSELSIYLHPSVQGKGVGRQLYTLSQQILQLQGYQRIYAIITSENPGSVAFHEKMGYQTVAQFPGCGVKFGRRLGTIWMEKGLNSVEIPTQAPIPASYIVNCDRKLNEVLAKMSLS